MPNFFEDVLVRLAKEKAEFIVVGGVSAVLQGAPVSTFDLDVCFRRTAENARRVAQAVAPLKPRLRDFPPHLPFVIDDRALLLGSNFTLTVEGGDLDLLSDMIGIGGYEQVVADATEVEIQGHRIKVLSLENLIRTKEAAGRPKDLATLPLLRTTLELKRREAP